MTANEMRDLFMELYNASSAVELDWDDYEVSDFLNIAQDELVKEALLKNKDLQRKSRTRHYLQDLNISALYSTVSYQYEYDAYGDFIGVKFENDGVVINDADVELENYEYRCNAKSFILPNNFMVLMNSEFMYEYSGERRIINPISLGPATVKDYCYNHLKKPSAYTSYVVLRLRGLDGENSPNDNIVDIVYDGDLIFLALMISYIRKPRKIVVDVYNPDNQVNCELSESMQYEIVKRAVDKALMAISDMRTELHHKTQNEDLQKF